jgi:hypothetical protein
MKKFIFFSAIIFAGVYWLKKPKTPKQTALQNAMNNMAHALDTIQTDLLTPSRSNAGIAISTIIPTIPVIPTFQTRFPAIPEIPEF